jgi:hypothetical protein
VSDVRIRRAEAEDLTFLATMLGESAVWRPDKATPSADEVLADPRYAMYLAGWHASLSVAVNNPARHLYESNGFVPVEKRATAWTMVRHAHRHPAVPT